ncbi:MAG: ribosome assembly cofactor RimP [Bacteroidales bacterium]|nr:ribosome assembly cofactor RimP [Bacteroidales bacterium]MDT8431782.1 ribosome assembly cofactor RimP [Bacteroidales bacterium]
MIQESKVRELVISRIKGSGLFLVDVVMGKSNDIRVLVDSMEGVRIEECVELSRWLTAELDQVDENFSLEVSSPGLGAPLVLKQQYEKNLGRSVEVVFLDGKKRKGILKAVDDEGIALEVTEKMVAGGSQKKKKNVVVSKSFAFSDIKSTKVVVEF